ncbi:unnamed protein product [Allacma fusca]|uniref:Carboxylic ester hydrolase n=1 Tax=Allacma fusca TaxID=39272 RepID=A0A8J2NQ26_9HEXA|nr:unnamed protein product [Allacma fusca]
MLTGTFLLAAIFSITSSAQVRESKQFKVLTTTPAGNFLGTTEVTRDGKFYYTFKGIPYAEKPGRFQTSVLKRPIDGQYNATYDRSICPQKREGDVTTRGDEDCLYLSVSHPHPLRCVLATTNGLLPVMFWIHPGAYRGGSGSAHKPNYLLDRCVVLVTINYRLGALGFLTTGDDVIPGNLGLKDQIVALRWTKNNIEHFRGDPERVTIFGSSAGGSSVTHHICSPASKGLFQHGISMSGTILNPWSITENPKYYAVRLGSRLNCPTSEVVTLRACLLEKSFDEIVDAQLSLSPPHIVFSPTIEPWYAKDPFQTQNPYSLLKHGQINNVPFMTGFVEDEGVYYASPILANQQLLSAINKRWTVAAPVQLFYDQLGIPKEDKDHISDRMRKYYFGSFEINESKRQQVVNLVSDRTIVQGTYETVELIAKHTRTYMYVNTYKGGVSYAQINFGYTIPVITHVDDEQYIFPKFQEWTSGPNYEFSLDMVELWTNFAKYGIPFGKCTRNAPWRQVQSSPVYQRIYKLDGQNSYLNNYLQDRTEFWRGLGLYKYEFGYKSVSHF